MEDLEKEGFGKFTGERRLASNELLVSIFENGRIGVNKKAYNDHLKKYKYVELFYNPKTNVIAIKGVNEKSKSALDIKSYESAGTSYLNAKSFFTFFGIKPKKRLGIKAIWDADSEALMVELQTKEGEKQEVRNEV